VSLTLTRIRMIELIQMPPPVPKHAVTRFESLSAAARSVWAKSGDPSGHGLLAHMLDVAAVAEQILNRESAIALL